AEDRLAIEATLFHHDYRDQIAYQITDFTTYAGGYLNLGETRAQGLELSLKAAPRSWLGLSGAYTYLDGKVLVSNDTFGDPLFAVGQPLLRRPRHQASFTAQATGSRADVAATLVYVGKRADGDFVGLGLTQNDAYTRLDVRAHV